MLPSPTVHADVELALRLDRLVAHAATLARPVASLTPDNAAGERARLIACLEGGALPVPAFSVARPRIDSAAYRAIDTARSLAGACWFGALYEERLVELELDLAILDAWGDPKRVRPLSARRYGRGSELVRTRALRSSTGLPRPEGLASAAQECVERPLSHVARSLLATLPQQKSDPATLRPDGDPREGRTVASYIRAAALGVGLDVEVKVEPRLASLAATGERTVFLADRSFSVREARRLTAHEVFGHLVVAANARAQPLRLLQIGLAGSFADQEGLALYLEEALGLLCSERLRTLAARVVATVQLYDGASFGETAHSLVHDHGFGAAAAISIAERTFRGGGVARDAGYLAGFLRIRAAIAAGTTQVDELRRGRVSLASLQPLRELESTGLVHLACYRPSLALSRKLTFGGTRADTSPPSDAASLTMLELT